MFLSSHPPLYMVNTKGGDFPVDWCVFLPLILVCYPCAIVLIGAEHQAKGLGCCPHSGEAFRFEKNFRPVGSGVTFGIRA